MNRRDALITMAAAASPAAVCQQSIPHVVRGGQYLGKVIPVAPLAPIIEEIKATKVLVTQLVAALDEHATMTLAVTDWENPENLALYRKQRMRILAIMEKLT